MKDVILLRELSNKEKTNLVANQTKSLVLNGEVNPLDVAMVIKNMDDFAKTLRSDVLVQDAIIEEIEKYGKTAEYKGMKFTIKEVGTSYDFSQCNDPVWNELNSKMEELSSQKKDRESFLKAIRGSQTIVDDATGEVVTICSPVKKSKTGYAAS